LLWMSCDPSKKGGIHGQGPSTLSRGSLKTAPIPGHAWAQYLHGIPHKEDRNVVADHIEVPFSCVKLDSKASRIRNRLGTTLFVNHSWKPHYQWRLQHELPQQTALDMSVHISWVLRNLQAKITFWLVEYIVQLQRIFG
jgi:hypothetical protein